VTDERFVLRLMSGLPGAAPDPRRSARTQLRCAALLADRAPSARVTRGRKFRGTLTPVVLGGFCVLYLSLIVRIVRSMSF